MPREARSLAVAGLALLLLLPLGTLELRRRNLEIQASQRTARLEKLETVFAALSGTERFANDWSRWDNIYRYVAGQNPGFLSKEVASSTVFDGGAVIAVFDRQGKTLFSNRSRDSRHQLNSKPDQALVTCASDNLAGLHHLSDSIWLGCRDQEGRYHLGVLTQISNDDSTAPANGALVIFEPLLHSDYGPHLKAALASLIPDFQLRPDTAKLSSIGSSASAAAEVIPGPRPLRGPAGQILVLRRESSLPGLGRGLLGDLMLLLALLLPVLLVRAAVMLERRRHTLLQLRGERRSIGRVRQFCQQLDRLLDRVGLRATTLQPEDEVLAKLLGERQRLENAVVNPEAMESRLEELARRFQRFLNGARSLALIDGLTQLPNRRYFGEQLELEASRHQLAGTSLAILFVDIDKFKDINDTYGHEIGDASLAMVARNLREQIGQHDFLARYGGDEFAILINLETWQHLEPASINQSLQQLAHQIARQFEQPSQVEDIWIEISLSIGISVLDPNKLNKNLALRQCDQAMTEAKRNKYNRISIFSLSDPSTGSTDYELYNDLLQAIRNHSLSVVFQPIVDENFQLYAVEALARWHHPQLGWINPEMFVGVAERYRQINLLGEELLSLALEGYVSIIENLNSNIRLSVNISPSKLQDPNLAKRVQIQLQKAGVLATSLTIELTEQAIIEASPTVNRNIESLRQQGVRLSLDDFGTGYSSLNLLNSLQPDEVKIDRSFVEAMSRDSHARQIVTLISQMAPSMGFELVAEGVSNSQSFELLHRYGIRHFQGFLFSPGVSAAEIRSCYLQSGIDGLSVPIPAGS